MIWILLFFILLHIEFFNIDLCYELRIWTWNEDVEILFWVHLHLYVFYLGNHRLWEGGCHSVEDRVGEDYFRRGSQYQEQEESVGHGLLSTASPIPLGHDRHSYTKWTSGCVLSTQVGEPLLAFSCGFFLSPSLNTDLILYKWVHVNEWMYLLSEVKRYILKFYLKIPVIIFTIKSLILNNLAGMCHHELKILERFELFYNWFTTLLY